MSVIVIDSDLRRPVLHQLFGVPNNRGLTSALLEDEPDPDGYLQATGVESLQILTSGPLPPNPSELLGSQRMMGLIEQLKEKADILLCDSPPVLAVTDTAVLANQVDGVLLVVDAGATRREAAQRGKEQLVKVGANLLGAALNKLFVKGRGYYYYYYYSEGEGKKRRRRHKSFEEVTPGVAGAIKRWIAELPFLGGAIKRGTGG